MKLSVIIVNYNVEHFLENCLLSVRKAARNITVEVFVVDNNSVDGSIQMLKQKFPEVQLICNEKNVGFSAANNQAIRQAKGEYILLLNPDTVVQEDTFEKTVRYMDEHADAGALGVKMIDGKGKFLPESKRGLPTPYVAFCKVFGLSALFPNTKMFGGYHLGYLDKDKIHEVDVLAGAFMLIRKKALDKVGLLDEDYFMYGEDIDLSYRIIQGGFKNIYYPETRIIHYKGESTKKSSVNYVLVFYKAMAIFANKHFATGRARLFSVFIFLAIIFRAGLALFRRFVNQITLPLIDAGLLFTGLLYIRSSYEEAVQVDFPETISQIALAIYTVLWLAFVFMSGGYDKPVRIQKISRGIIWGSAAILVIYALLPEHLRFSRAVILLGTGWALLSLPLLRMLLHLTGINRFRLEGGYSKRIVIAGDTNEFKRVHALLKESNAKASFIGWVDTSDGSASGEHYLGKFSQLEEVLQVYDIDEVIFCSRNVTSEKIIECMAGLDLEFKIAPEESLSIIGSSSINTAGELYVIDVNSVNKPSNRRKKRIIDILFSIIYIALYPVLILVVKSPLNFLLNILKVLAGTNTWVGYERTPEFSKKQRGVIYPSDFLPADTDPDNAARFDRLNAKDYNPFSEVKWLMRGIRKLGS